ncbi:LysM domain protein [Microscilla marina ATCC 23134]|uniref:LysM domain protein n=1 Tax=Microscilla marina ATCC 23134 TaxID=313606 RepID=A1ZC29_MICM2|nr:LysM domain protein [Microscilla marina ATCC 23134]
MQAKFGNNFARAGSLRRKGKSYRGVFKDRGGETYTVDGKEYNNYGNYNPYDGQHTIVAGNTYTGLSKRYYGNSSMASSFMKLHQKLEKKFVPGETIVVNFEREGRHVKLARLNVQAIDFYKTIEQEGLGGIASRYNITTDLLINMNANLQLQLFKAGDEIRIPQPFGTITLKLTKDTTAEALAQKYKISLATIVDLNLKAGAVLAVPGSTYSQKTREKIKPGNKTTQVVKHTRSKFGTHTLSPENVDILLNKYSKYTAYVANKGDNLWKIMHKYWGNCASMYTEQSYYNLVHGLVLAMLEVNNLKLNSQGKIDGFLPNSPIYIIVPDFHSNDHNSNKKRKTNKKKNDPSKILTDEQSAKIGKVLNYTGGALALIDITRKKMGENNKVNDFLKSKLGQGNYSKLIKILDKGLKAFNKAATIAAFTKLFVDIKDGRYVGKPENLFFDVVSTVAGLHPYGAIMNAFLTYIGVDGDTFRAFCKQEGNIEIPLISSVRTIGTGESKVTVHTFTPFTSVLSNPQNVPPPHPDMIAKKALNKVLDKKALLNAIKNKKVMNSKPRPCKMNK